MAVHTSSKTLGKTADSIQEFGRVLLIRCSGPLDGEHGSSATPVEEIVSRARRSGARVVLLDLSHSPYADSGGLRWLLTLQRTSDQEGFALRIVAASGSRVRRNLVLLGAGLDLYSDSQIAWYGRSHFEHGLTPDPMFGQHPPQPAAIRA